jgi:hypothetical protein
LASLRSASIGGSALTPSASPAVSFAALTVAPSFSSWSFCDLDDWCTTLENQFPGNRYFIPLLNAELNRRLALMPPVVVDPELEAIIPF